MGNSYESHSALLGFKVDEEGWWQQHRFSAGEEQLLQWVALLRVVFGGLALVLSLFAFSCDDRVHTHSAVCLKYNKFCVSHCSLAHPRP